MSLLTSQPASCALHGLAGLPSPLNLSQASATPWMGGHPESIWHQFPQLLLLVHVMGDLRDEEMLLVQDLVLPGMGVRVLAATQETGDLLSPTMDFSYGEDAMCQPSCDIRGRANRESAPPQSP